MQSADSFKLHHFTFSEDTNLQLNHKYPLKPYLIFVINIAALHLKTLFFAAIPVFLLRRHFLTEKCFSLKFVQQQWQFLLATERVPDCQHLCVSASLFILFLCFFSFSSLFLLFFFFFLFLLFFFLFCVSSLDVICNQVSTQ